MALEPRKERTLREVLKRRADKLGDKPWIVTAERAYSYREMDQRSNALARGFLKQGIKHGDTVLIMLPDTIDYILAWCALAKIGAIEVPVNNHAKGTVFAHIVNDSLARTMIVDRQYLDRIEFVLGELKDLKRLVLYSKDATGKEAGLPASLSGRLEELRFEKLFDADESALKEPGPTYRDIMGVMYTSGTTGPSKGSMNCHAHAYEYAVVAVELLEMQPDDIYYAPLPMFHIAGQWAVVYACMIAECTAVLTGTFSLTEFWNDVRKYKATISFLLGAMANFLYRQAPLPNDADNTMDRIIVVPLLPEVEDFKTRFGVRVSTTYGGTEQNCPMRSGFDLVNNRTCGRPLLDRYEVRLVDENDEEVPPNVPGEMCVRTKNPWDMTLGYWNHPDWTVRSWRNLWYHTGDMLMRDEDGNYYFVDRTKDAIRRRGENISSMEVEQEIVKHPAILECAVIPAESVHTEQEVMAVIVPKQGMTVDPVELIRFLEPRMAYFMIPRYVDTIDALPKTPTGKIQKFPLRERGLTPTTWDREKAGVKLKR